MPVEPAGDVIAQRPDVEPQPLGIDRDPLAIRHDARPVGIVDHLAQLGQRPAQRGARVVGQIPEQFAQALAPMRPPGRHEEGQQRPRLARGRQRKLLPATVHPQLAQKRDAERVVNMPCLVLHPVAPRHRARRPAAYGT